MVIGAILLCFLFLPVIVGIYLVTAFFDPSKNGPNPYRTEKQEQDLDSKPIDSVPSYVRIKKQYFKNLYVIIGLACMIFALPFGCGIIGGEKSPSDFLNVMMFLLFILGPILLALMIINSSIGVSYYWEKMKTPKEERLKWEAAQRAEQERKKQQAEQEKIEQKRLSDLQKPQAVTPLLQSILDGNKEAAEKALKEYPDYINIPYASNGNTPLHVAVWNEHKDIVKLLLAQPAIDTQLKNKDGKTALDLAQEKNLTEIVNLLRNR